MTLRGDNTGDGLFNDGIATDAELGRFAFDQCVW